MNVARTYPCQGEQQRRRQRSGHKKDILGGQKIADHAHESRSGEAADRGEALIAPKPFGKRVVPNEPEADGGDTWAENTSSRALHDEGSRNPCEVGP